MNSNFSQVQKPGVITSTSNIGEQVQEYSIRVPKTVSKKYHLMRFNSIMNMDFAKWSNVKLERENNLREFKGVDEEQPKFGAGSEFGRDAREEARRKKLGFAMRKYKPEDQPWILKIGGKNGKKYKGVREGGVAENASYYVFVHATDGGIEAYPLQEWYNFTPIQRFKALSAEEAEQEFINRNKVLNYFSVMMRKRLRGEEEEHGEEGAAEDKKSGKKEKKELTISEMDEWMDSSSEEESDEEGEGKKKKDSDDELEDKKKKKAAKGKKPKKRDVDDEAFEDSDDGDEEGRELDYITSSSESEPEIEKQLQGVDAEKGLRKLLTSDEDSEEEEKSSKESNDEENEESSKEKKLDGKDAEENKKRSKKLKKKDSKKKKDDGKSKDSSSELSPNSSDSDSDSKKKKEQKKDEKDTSENNIVPVSNINKEPNSAGSSRSATPVTDLKRKYNISLESNSINKKIKLDMPSGSSSSDVGITEDAVRRYLMRKPMTTTELLQKFKTKKTGLNSEQLVNIMTQILKKINPIKQTIKGKMYLSIKS